MTNPFQDIEESFRDMFQDYIGISCSRPNQRTERTNLQSCVFPIEDIDPFSGSDEDSDIKRIQVLVMKSDWTFKEPMKTGDEITLEDGTKWKVSNVDVEHAWFKIQARSI